MKETVKNILSYVLVIALALLIKEYIFSPIKVNGPSMNPTLFDGDIMILNEIGYYLNGVKRFDIVVVDTDDDKIIKRVIGLPGESVEYKDNKLYINGKQVDDPYPSTKTDDFSIQDVGHEKVPGDTYFVMGDNRDDSLDSRYPEVGVIRKSKILGRAKFVIWPFNKFGFVK